MTSTKRLLSLALTIGAACQLALALPLGSLQAAPFRDGQSFYIVATRADVDTALFRVCGPGERQARELHFPGLELRPGSDTRTVDTGIKNRIEAGFERQKRFRVTPTVDAADYVLVAEATFIRATEGGGPIAYERLSAAHEPEGLVSILAIAVPAAAYTRTPRDAGALLPSALWRGASIGEGSRAASVEDVVLQLHGGIQRREGNTVRTDNPTPPVTSRLNGRTICGVPQPQRAQAIPTESEYLPDAPGERVPPRSMPSETPPDRPIATFRTRVVAVAVPVVASDRQGMPVGGLGASDFKLFEENVLQRIDRLTAETEPLTAALVLDTSYSMLPRLVEVRAAASAFIDALRPEDRGVAVTFDSRPWLLCDVTRDKDALRRAIARLQPFGALTRLHDALDLVTEERLEKIAGRKVIVVLTDGMDVGSRFAGAGSIMARLEAANIPVYAVQFESKPRAKTALVPRQRSEDRFTPDSVRYFDRIYSLDQARQYLQQLTRNTGGLLLPAATPDAIVQAFRQAADDVRSQYVLYYYPTNQAQDGTFRPIRVEVTRPGVTVRARAGYRAPGGDRKQDRRP